MNYKIYNLFKIYIINKIQNIEYRIENRENKIQNIKYKI